MAMHRTLMSAFPDGLRPHGSARAALDVLYRVDTSYERPVLLVQSAVYPNWARLPPEWTEDVNPPVVKEIGYLIQGIGDGAVLRFKLIANPTKKISAKSGVDRAKNNGRRVPLRGEAEWIPWLVRKGEQNGFRLAAVYSAPNIPDVRSIGQIRTKGLKLLPDGSPARLTFAGVVFEGRLEVTEAGLFRTGIRGGIGSGKAYGYGLLSVAPGGGL
jgi:CRISPR system Cascade subunit CasE